MDFATTSEQYQGITSQTLLHLRLAARGDPFSLLRRSLGVPTLESRIGRCLILVFPGPVNLESQHFRLPASSLFVINCRELVS